MIEIRRIEISQYLDGLAALLVDVVAGGSSVGFMDGFATVEARAYFSSLEPEIAAGSRIVLAALDGSVLVGSAQLICSQMPNQLHRADVAKVLVARSARRQGIARALMSAIEDEARARGRSLLVLDTGTGTPAEQMYEALGWVRVGEIPGYALNTNGTLLSTTFFYKTV